MSDDKQARIAELNDAFRRTFVGGVVVQTAGVAALTSNQQAQLQIAVQTFDAFTDDNDPYGEHDFGQVKVDGQTVFFKLDYYSDQSLEYGSEDPSDPSQTTRVMTLMLAEEY